MSLTNLHPTIFTLQKAQRLLEQVQAGDSAVEPHAMWQLEQQTVLRARVTTLYMNLYYRKQLASVMKSELKVTPSNPQTLKPSNPHTSNLELSALDRMPHFSSLY